MLGCFRGPQGKGPTTQFGEYSYGPRKGKKQDENWKQENMR